jgi:hypothetical protein
MGTIPDYAVTDPVAGAFWDNSYYSTWGACSNLLSWHHTLNCGPASAGLVQMILSRMRLASRPAPLIMMVVTVISCGSMHEFT